MRERYPLGWFARRLGAFGASGALVFGACGPTQCAPVAPAPVAPAPVAPEPSAGGVALDAKPVEPPCTYTDTFGAARGAGRVHLGTDIAAAEGNDVYAVVPGEVIKVYADSPGSLAGNGLRIVDADGTVFFYAHLSALAPRVAVGTKVAAGQVVGFVGQTGNAGGPHLHLEIHRAAATPSTRTRSSGRSAPARDRPGRARSRDLARRDGWGRDGGRFGARRWGNPQGMAIISRVVPRSLLNPVSRLALMTFAWNHRHEILRWGRTMYDQLVGRTDVSPARAVRTGRVLFAIASDADLRNARQLRKVTMNDDVVDLDVAESWTLLPKLIDHVSGVRGVRQVLVNGRPLEPRRAVVTAVPA